MIRPGPPALPPGACPDGVVIHLYLITPDPPMLLLSHAFRPLDDVEADADLDGLMVNLAAGADAPVCLVAYDGDTGRRFTAAEWMAARGR